MEVVMVVALGWFWIKERHIIRPQRLAFRRRLIIALASLLMRVYEVRLLPQVLEAARLVHNLEELPEKATWYRAESEALARLLPRMTTSEIQALPETHRIYLRGCLEREVSEDATVAILLTLASAQDPSAFVLAQRYAGSASPRVQLAAQECLTATKI